MNEIDSYTLTVNALSDLEWFVKFFQEFNCQAIIRSQFVATVIIFVDACLVGAGSSWSGKKYLAYKWPEHVLNWNININELELFNVVVTMRIWAKELSGKIVRLWCDNNTAVMSLFNGKTRNSFMGACLREMWWIARTNDIFLSCEHIAGKDNNEADMLSRAYVSIKSWQEFQDFKSNSTAKWDQLYNSHLYYPDRL